MEKIQRSQEGKYNSLTAYFVIVLAMAAVVFFLWLPFGFTLIGLIEEWTILGKFQHHGLYSTINEYGSYTARPLTILPFAIAHYLDPHSFFYWHVLMMLALLIKGCSAGQLIWKITGSLKWAIVMGVMLLLYPADTMQLSFRSMHINWALALQLLASSLMVIAFEDNRRIRPYILTMFAGAMMLVSICIYEASILLAPLPFLLLYAKSGWQICWRQLWSKMGLLVTWIIAPSLFVVYFMSVTQKSGSYQRQLVGEKMAAAFANAMPNLAQIGLLRGLVGGWYDAAKIVLTELNGYTYLITVMLFFVIVLGCIRKPKFNASLSTLDNYMPLRLAIVGIMLLMLGYLPFLFSASHLAISQRTFLYASFGATLCWVALLFWMSSGARIWKFVSSLIIAASIFFGLGTQLFQFHHYIQLGEMQRKTLKSIVENVQIGDKTKTVVIRDESNVIGHTWMLLKESLPGILSYLYDQPVKTVEICRVPSNEWLHRDNLARTGSCIESAEAWVLRAATPVKGDGYIPAAKPQDIRLPKRDVVTIRIDINGLASSDPSYQNELLTENSTKALRYRGVLTEKLWPLQLIQFKPEVQPDHYKWSFGKWWSLDLPERGNGWREAEWEVGKFYHHASAWKSQPNSSLYFDFLPTQDQYVLRGKFVYFVNEKIYKSTVIRINQTVIPLHWQNNTTFEASIPKGVLHKGLNRIDFNSDIDMTYYGLSSKLAWFEITARSNGIDDAETS